MIEQRWENQIKNIDSNLYLTYDKSLGLLEIRHKIPFTSINRRVMYIHNNFSYRPMGDDIINELKNNYDWESIYRYQDNKDLADHYLSNMEKEREAKEKFANEERVARYKDEMSLWKKAKEEFINKMTRQQYLSLKRKDDKEKYLNSSKPKYF